MVKEKRPGPVPGLLEELRELLLKARGCPLDTPSQSACG